MGNKIDVKTIAIDIAFPIMFDNVTVSLVVRWWQRHLPNSVLHVMSFTLRLLFIFIYYYFTEVPKKKKLRKGNFSLISLIETNKYFYQFSRFFQNILQFRAFHCSQWKTRFSSLLLGGNILTPIFQNAMSQSSQGTKASNAHDAVPMFCEHPLKILKAKTIKFWYNEGQLVSVPKGQSMDRLSKEYKRR